MLIKIGNKSKRRRMYFRESSRRDNPDLSKEEEQKRWNMAYVEFCSDCMEKYGLQKGKCVRTLGVCRLCGNDGWIHGRMQSSDDALDGIITIDENGTFFVTDPRDKNISVHINSDGPIPEKVKPAISEMVNKVASMNFDEELDVPGESIRCECCGSKYDDTGILFDPSNESGICGQCLSEE